MVRICRERRLAYKNHAGQLKKAAEQKKALLEDAQKQGKTKEQYLKELRAKNQARHKEIYEKRKADIAKAKSEKRKYEKPKKAARRPTKQERILAKNPALAAAAKAKEATGKQDTVVPVSKKNKGKSQRSAARRKVYADKINKIAIRRIKGYKIHSIRQKQLAHKKKVSSGRNRAHAKAQLGQQYLSGLKQRRILKNRAARIKKAVAKAEKAKQAGTAEKPKKKKTVVKKTAAKKAAPVKKTAKVAKPAKAAKAAKPAAAKTVKPQHRPVKISPHLRRVLLAEIKQGHVKAKADRKAKKAAKKAVAKTAAPSTETKA